MGWTSLHRSAGVSDRDFFASELGADYTILEAASYDRSEVYLAVRDRRDGRTFAMAILVQWTPSAYYNFSFKDMHETVGPVIDRAPARVLDLLSETHSEWAIEWRARCRARLAAAAARPTVRKGDTIHLAAPLTFTDGSTASDFTLVRGSIFALPTGGYVRIPKWRERGYTLAV